MLKLMADTAYLLVHFVWKFSQDLITLIVTSPTNMGSEISKGGRQRKEKEKKKKEEKEKDRKKKGLRIMTGKYDGLFLMRS